MPVSKKPAALVPALLALALAGCGKQTFLAAALVQTPQLANPADPAHPIPPYVVLTTYLGTIDASNPARIDASKIGVVTGAKGWLAFHHAASGAGDASEDRLVTIPESTSQPGLYQVNSQSESKLTFEQGVPYTLILQTPGGEPEAFGARVTPGPGPALQEFPSATSVVEHAVGQPFVVTRTEPLVDGARLPAFVVVGRIDPQNPKAEPQITYKTVPAEPKAMLEFVLSDAGYRWTTTTIPATAFPVAGAYYVVSVLSVRTGPVSENAFLGSTAIAATGTGGLVHTHP